MSQIEYSSIPGWARAAAPTTDALPDLGGRSYVFVGVGAAAATVVDGWVGQVPEGLPTGRIVAEDVDDAADELREHLGSARVGVRLALAGPTGSCLRLRGVATDLGIEDDEMHVTSCGAGPIDVFCSHCGATTAAVADVDDLVDCTDCGRTLLVYYHVSRRTGRYLGFMADAETPGQAAPPLEESSR